MVWYDNNEEYHVEKQSNLPFAAINSLQWHPNRQK